MTLNPFLCIDLSISDSLRSVRKSVLIYETIIEYIIWFREKRIKMSLGGVSPMEYRRSLGLA
ncbi:MULTISPECIES: IS3 family transposase [Anaerostipes]|uniref:IS3 family transposase n=1 Tax=Anaerostipes TaxID=207244 RepID=UPI0009C06AB0